MVFKVTKGGVRSGNTLRGLNSNTNKRYGRHACLLGYTSLGRRDLTRLIRDESEDNQLVSETLAKTDVLLSLNKQQRWRLPAMIGQMIKAGDFNKGAVVSLLEKHKLKRKANCVNLVSNSSRTSSINPKNNKYFSFSLDNVADSKSRRERRRDRVEELKRLKISTNAAIKKLPKNRNNVVHTFTSDGLLPKLSVPTKTGSTFDADKPEYRLEVFYPCPKSCSLAYNPKYTDVALIEGKTGELEVKSNVKTQKKGVSTHRKRLSSRDMERLYCDEIEGDVGEMWGECYDEINDVVRDDDVSNELAAYYYHQHSEINSTEYTMDALLAQAKRTKELCVMKKGYSNSSNQTKSSICSSRRGGVVSFPEEDEKPHIVFVDNDKENNFNRGVKQPTHDNKDNDVNKMEGQGNYRDFEYFRVVLSTSETDREELRRNFGTLYAESSCQPRRFILDITDDVTNLLASSRSLTTERLFTSYLVFVYDGFYDNGLSAYKVAFNSMVGGKMAGLSELLPFTQTSISNIMNGLACHLLDTKEKNCLEYVERNIKETVKVDAEFLNSRMKLKVEVFDPSNEISNLAKSSVAREKNVQTMDASESEIHADMEDDVFCDVCYASVTSSRIDSVSGTKLKSCGHILCDECWRSHFRTGISDGKTVMSCGGYDCSTEVGPVTLMSLLNVSEVALLLKRHTEEEIETMENAKWCPNPVCGRVIKVDSNSKSQDLCVDVQCACGNKLCFSCMGPAHWPATCDQAEEYLERLPTLSPAKEYVEENETKPSPFMLNKKSKKPVQVRIEGRLCPRCKKFIEKNGGCPYMVCKCGFQMCWTCMKMTHGDACKPDYAWVNSLSRTVVVNHAVTKDIVPPTDSNPQELPKIQKNKRKATLYQRALKQREEIAVTTKYRSSYTAPLVHKMAKASQRDSQFKREMMRLFTNTNNNTRETNTIDDASLSLFNAFSHLKKFITTTVEMKSEMHRVREYTYILLQGMPHSVAKQRIQKLSDDLNGFCSLVTSILDLQDNQDAVTAFRRLVDLQRWAERALDALIRTTQSLRKA